MHGPQGIRPSYFLIVSQDSGYIWDQREPGPVDAPPAIGFSMEPVVRQAFPQLPDRERLQGDALVLVVGAWLNRLATGASPTSEEPDRALEAVGLLELMQGGTVVFDNER